MHRASIARGLATKHLDGVGRLRRAVGPDRLIDDAEVALADLLLDGEVPELAADRELLLPHQGDDVADARVDLLAGMEDDVDERVETIAVEAALGERTGVAPLGARTADLVGDETEQALAHRRHLLEREKALELTAQNVDRRVHAASTPVARNRDRDRDQDTQKSRSPPGSWGRGSLAENSAGQRPKALAQRVTIRAPRSVFYGRFRRRWSSARSASQRPAGRPSRTRSRSRWALPRGTKAPAQSAHRRTSTPVMRSSSFASAKR